MRLSHKLLMLFMMGLFLPLLAQATIRITEMRVNGLDEPRGTDPDGKTVFSWILTSDKARTVQTAYRITVSSRGEKLWDTGKVKSDNSIAVPFEGTLAPDTEYPDSRRWSFSHIRVVDSPTCWLLP